MPMSVGALALRNTSQGRTTQLLPRPAEGAMDWGYKAVLTAVTVAAVLMAAQVFGRRLAGMLAGLPVITAPALLWLAQSQGAAFAAQTAVGSVAACGAAAVFALAYERLARRLTALATLAGSLAIGGLAALALSTVAWQAGLAAICAALGCVVAWAALPRPVSTAPAGRRLRGEVWLVAAAAGAVCALIGAWSTQLGPYWSGLLASLPIVSACALVHQQLTAPADELRRLLRGYIGGLAGKAVFGLLFAALVGPLPAAAAVLLAAGLTAALTLALTLTVTRLAPQPRLRAAAVL